MSRMTRFVLATLLAILSYGAVQAQEPTQIRIFVGLGTGSKPEQQVLEDAVAQLWNDSHSDTKITFDYNGNATARDVLLTQVAGDNPPDLIGPVGIYGVFSTFQLWEDLAPYIARDQAALKLGDYDPAILKMFQDAGGHNLSVALGIYPSFLYVNEDLFSAAEVPLLPKEFGAPYTDKDGNRAAWDWDEVAKVGKLLTSDSDGKYSDEAGFNPIRIQNYGYVDFFDGMRHVAMQFGAVDSGLATDGKTSTFNQPAFVNAMQWYQNGMFKDHFIPDLEALNTLSQGTTPFESGRIGMWYSHTWYTCCLGGAHFKWGIYAAPAVNGTNGKKIIAPMHADTLAMLAKGKNKNAAWEVLKWLNSSEIASQLCLIYGCLPARKSARSRWEKDIVQNFSGMDLKVIYDSIAYLDIPSHESYLPNYAQASDLLDTVWDSIRSNPNLDIRETMDNLNNTEQNIFEGNFPTTSASTPP